jgi:hypothetical protein
MRWRRLAILAVGLAVASAAVAVPIVALVGLFTTPARGAGLSPYPRSSLCLPRAGAPNRTLRCPPAGRSSPMHSPAATR